MKYYFLAAMMVVSACGFAQKPALTDDLNTGLDSIAGKYGITLYANYALDPVQFNEKMDLARREAYRRIKPGETTLKRLDVDSYLRNALSLYKIYHGDKAMTDVQEKYTDSLVYSDTDPNNATLFMRSMAYRNWISDYLLRLCRTKYHPDTTSKSLIGRRIVPISVIEGEIRDTVIRDYECYRNAAMNLRLTKDSILAKKIYEEFNAAVTNDYYKDQMQHGYNNYKLMHTGHQPAPDFTYAAVDGKPITLSNLRGKYVYIDIWSTYCPHCIEEFPALAKMEEKYKDKNIRFVSLSLDDQSWKDRWHRFVIDHQLPGYQVISDKSFESDFIKKINIVSIPRFMLIDPAGNIVDGDAKRPSNPELQKQFDELLK